ncbi:hypothetical protein NQ314_009020 [Rhamnusium bicolor]|uniref:Glutamine amidotransferase domain-containing protein n=1 Tax=Rhamnusium bicolor TaxID=1586634 RepID=A0AAV8Y387_9CUCU|nr:hypothetical protein NQ314_009020 [Rhamnusium bicolor]
MNFESSKLFLNAPKDILNTLNSKNVTFNYHKFCLTKAVLKEKGILPNWRILATNRDESNLQFISAMESVDYPIYGVQFHPEKNQFEFELTAISHTSEAIKISQYFANFFVEECRKSKNSFPNKTILKKALIYNYNPRYTGLTDVTYEQVYVFNKSDFRKVQLK